MSDSTLILAAKSLAGLLLSLLFYGCTAPQDASGPQTTPPEADVSAGIDPALIEELPPSMVIDARPAALLGGRPIRWGELKPILNEAAGAEALTEVILDRRLAEAVEEEGLLITAEDEAAEQKRLLETLAEDDPNRAIRLLDELRDQQRLGPHRYRALLRRNAIMRALVQDRVRVTDEAVRRMHDALHGPRRQARIITCPDLSDAQHVRSRVLAGEFFGDVSVEVSTDSSAARGGLLEPVSRDDPSYPAALRQAIWSLEAPGDLSDPVLIDSGYAVVQLVREIGGEEVALEESREKLEKLVRLNQERILMDQLARHLLTGARLTIFDKSLESAWERREVTR